MRCLLIGNYGVGNIGDELLKDYFLDTFSEVSWIVVSAHPSEKNEIARLPFGVRSLLRFNWIKTIGAYLKVDAVVFGGGSLWTDVESVLACFLWTLHLLPALCLRKPVFLVFQGVGPFKTGMGERLARFAVLHAAFISVRDEASMERIQKWALNIKVVQTFDPVFSAMCKQKMNQNIKNVCTIIPRANSTDQLMNEAISALRIRPYIHHVQILLMQPDAPEEQLLAARLQRELGLPATILPVKSSRDLMKGVGGSTIVVTQRFHGALAAIASGVEVNIVPQEKGDKMYELQQMIRDGKADVHQLDAIVEEGRVRLTEALHIIESEPHSW